MINKISHFLEETANSSLLFIGRVAECVWPAAPRESVWLERGALIRADYVEGRPLRWHAGRGKRFLQPGGERLAVAEAVVAGGRAVY